MTRQPWTTETLADRIEIEDLLQRYTVAIDAKDWDGLDVVFTPDAHIDYTSSGGPAGPFPEIKAWLAEVLVMFPMTQHLIGKSTVDLDGDTAHCSTLFHNPMGVPVDGDGFYDPEGDGLHVFVVGGSYVDTCVRTPEGWRISQKLEQQAFTQGGFPPAKQA